MNNKIKRYLELITRKQYLQQVFESLNKEIDDKIMMMFATAFDKNLEDKATAQIAIIEAWQKEIDDEIYELKKYIENDYYATQVEKFCNNVDDKIKERILKAQGIEKESKN